MKKIFKFTILLLAIFVIGFLIYVGYAMYYIYDTTGTTDFEEATKRMKIQSDRIVELRRGYLIAHAIRLEKFKSKCGHYPKSNEWNLIENSAIFQSKDCFPEKESGGKINEVSGKYSYQPEKNGYTLIYLGDDLTQGGTEANKDVQTDSEEMVNFLKKAGYDF